MGVLRERPEIFFRWVTRIAFAFAVALFALGIAVDRSQAPFAPFMLVTGLLLMACGVALVTNYRGLLPRLSDLYRHSWQWRLSGQGRFTRFHGVCALLVGFGWTAIAIGTL